MDISVRLVAKTQPCIEEGVTAEEFIAYCARVSNPNNQFNHGTAAKLLKYCADHQHWSIFETVSLTLEIQTTRDIGRQILRHRSFSFQEFSQRYAAVEDSQFHLSEVRMQDTKNRQNSIESDDFTMQKWWLLRQEEILNLAKSIYSSALSHGIAKEVARKVLPEGLTMSRMYMTGSLRSWIHYILVRTDSSTQKEHRVLAEMARDIVLAEFPSLSEII